MSTAMITDTIRETRLETRGFYFYDYSFNNTIITHSAHATYSYLYTKYPLGPPEITDAHFISCDDGNISLSQVGGTFLHEYRLLSQSNTCNIISPKRLEHKFQYTLGSYIGIKINEIEIPVMIKVNEIPVSGTTYYNLSL